MVLLSKVYFYLSRNQRSVQVHKLRIPQLIRLLHKNEEIEEVDLTDINIQLMNQINYVNPYKIISNINNNIRIKEDLKCLKKKISFNHLLLRQIVNNRSLQIYEFKKKQEGTKDYLLQLNDEGGTTSFAYGRQKRKIKWKGTITDGAGEKDIPSRRKQKGIELSGLLDRNLEMKETTIFPPPKWEEQRKEHDLFFDLSKNYSNFVLENILKHICDYIYNFEKINKLNKEENNSYETVSILCIADIFFNFFQIKYGYKWMLHFLNGISIYKIKKNIPKLANWEQSLNTNGDFLDGLYSEKKNSFFEKEYDVSYILNYLSKNEKEIEHLLTKTSEKENQCSSLYTDNSLYKLQGHEKSVFYIVDIKENILIVYDFNKSFLKKSLPVLMQKYNIYKINFSKFCMLLLLYSISNKFIIPFFDSVSLLFINNKNFVDVNNCVAILTASIFFLKEESGTPCFYPYNIYCYEDNTTTSTERNEERNEEINKKINEEINSNINSEISEISEISSEMNTDKNAEPTNDLTNDSGTFINDGNSNKHRHRQTREDMIILKKKIYELIEQIINYLFINREVIQTTQLLQLLEILSYIKYNKKLFTFIFNQVNEMLSLLNKYQLLYFLHSLSNYQIVCETTKRNVFMEMRKNMEQYTKEEIASIEQYL